MSLILVAGVLGGLLAKKIGFPGGPVVGAMLGTGVMAVFLPGTFVIPDGVSTAVQIMLGVSLGISFDHTFLALCGKLLPLAVLSTWCCWRRRWGWPGWLRPRGTGRRLLLVKVRGL